jgi:hypothetical protein
LLFGPDMDGTSSVSAGAPLATIDILGRPIAFRIAERMKRFGVDTVYMVGQVDTLKNAPAVPADVQFVAADGAPWRDCEDVFSEVAQSGADLVLVQRIGPYLELDYEDLIGLHLDRRNRVTPVCGTSGDPLGVFCISASRRNDAAFLFRHQLQESRTPCIGYTYRGYCNPLQSGADLRRLTLDALNGTAQLPPAGRQIRPGVWLGEGARIERGARVLAPAFIGAHTVVHPAAVITRFSSVEHHAEIDCGTVIEDASVLPYTYVGAGLDVAHSVVGNQRLLNLPRNVEIEIGDPKLVRTLSEHAPIRALSALASPKRLLQNVLGLRKPQPASLPAAVKAPSAALKSPASLRAAAQSGDSEFPANLMVARRYGNE